MPRGLADVEVRCILQCLSLAEIARLSTASRRLHRWVHDPATLRPRSMRYVWPTTLSPPCSKSDGSLGRARRRGLLRLLPRVTLVWAPRYESGIVDRFMVRLLLSTAGALLPDALEATAPLCAQLAPCMSERILAHESLSSLRSIRLFSAADRGLVSAEMMRLLRALPLQSLEVHARGTHDWTPLLVPQRDTEPNADAAPAAGVWELSSLHLSDQMDHGNKHSTTPLSILLLLLLQRPVGQRLTSLHCSAHSLPPSDFHALCSSALGARLQLLRLDRLDLTRWSDPERWSWGAQDFASMGQMQAISRLHLCAVWGIDLMLPSVLLLPSLTHLCIQPSFHPQHTAHLAPSCPSLPVLLSFLQSRRNAREELHCRLLLQPVDCISAGEHHTALQERHAEAKGAGQALATMQSNPLLASCPRFELESLFPSVEA